MAKIFVSYRRRSSAFTLLLANKLSERLDAEIFVDFQSIDQADFERSILTHLRESDVFLLMVTEHTFSPRIHHDEDWVRKEIQVALERDIPIILVCENGLFPPADLPEDIRQIRAKQGIEFYPQYFDAAVSRLVKFLGKATDIPLKNQSSDADRLPVPPSQLEDVEIDQSEVSEQNAQQILRDAIAAYDANDYAQALFLFEALKDIGYQSRMIDIDNIIDEVETQHAYEEAKRRATVDYDEIAIFSRSERTLPQALKAFQKWKRDNPDFVEVLDTEGLQEKLEQTQRKAKPKEQSTPEPPKSEPVANALTRIRAMSANGQVSLVEPEKTTDDAFDAFQAAPDDDNAETDSLQTASSIVKIPDSIVIAAAIIGAENMLLDNLQWEWLSTVNDFFDVHWVLKILLLIVAFGWGIIVAGGSGIARENSLGDAIAMVIFFLVVGIPGTAFVLIFYDGAAPLAFAGAVAVSYVFATE